VTQSITHLLPVRASSVTDNRQGLVAYTPSSPPEIEARVWGLGFGVWGLGFGVWGLGFTFVVVRGLGFRRFLRGLGGGKIDTAAAPGMRVGFRVSGFGFKASGFGFRI
jgi:hypothetical protein